MRRRPATSSFIVVLLVFFLDRADADERLRAMRGWIARNNPALMAGLVLFIGAMLAAKGMVGLLA